MHAVCNNCRWFDVDDRCRRYPPVPRSVGAGEGAGIAGYEWPKVDNNDFCGEWSSKHDALHVAPGRMAT